MEEPKIGLALAFNVPQLFIVLLGDCSFLVSAPDLEWLSGDDEPACTICGDTPYPGQRLLDHVPDFESTCQRCHPEYLCNLCLCDHKVCLACLEPREEDLLDDKRRCRLAALKQYWEIQDEQEVLDGNRLFRSKVWVDTQGPGLKGQ